MSLPRYPEYKASGVEWLGEVPGHWDVKRLRFVAELNPSKSEVAELDKETPVSFLPMDAIGDDGKLNLEYEKQIAEVETGYTFFRDGDVTVAKITPCFENGKGAVMRGLSQGIGFGTTELIVARPIASQTCSDYLHALFTSVEFRKNGEGHMYGAGGQKRVPDDFVRNFAIAFPPVEEQQIIAAFLDRETGKIDALIAEQRRLVELLAEKRQAVISHAVTKGLNPNATMKDSGIEWLGVVPKHWEVKRLRFVAELNPSKSEVATLDKETLVSFLPMDAIGDDGRLNLEREKPIADVETGYTFFRDGDVTVAKITPCFENGKGAVMRGLTQGIGFGTTELIVARPIASQVSSDYLHSLFTSVVFRKNGEGHMYGAGGQKRVPDDFVRNFEIAFPSIEEQQAIAAFLDTETSKFDTLTAEVNRAIALLQERRSALISAAVTGKIDVRGYDFESALAETRADVAAGRFVQESVEAHLARCITD